MFRRKSDTKIRMRMGRCFYKHISKYQISFYTKYEYKKRNVMKYGYERGTKIKFLQSRSKKKTKYKKNCSMREMEYIKTGLNDILYIHLLIQLSLIKWKAYKKRFVVTTIRMSRFFFRTIFRQQDIY